MECSNFMLKFIIPFAIVAVAPLAGVQAESTTGKTQAVGCHPDFNKGRACRIAATSSNVETPSSAATGACHPEWSKGRACAVRVANAVRESKVAAAGVAQPVRVANSD